MSEAAKMRMERINRLFKELEYEIIRGITEREIEEEFGYQFCIPFSRHFSNGAVWCRFDSRPVEHMGYLPLHDDSGPKLKLVKNEKKL